MLLSSRRHAAPHSVRGVTDIVNMNSYEKRVNDKSCTWHLYIACAHTNTTNRRHDNNRVAMAALYGRVEKKSVALSTGLYVVQGDGKL